MVLKEKTKNALLIISFGSSYPEARKTLERVENYISERYPQHDCFHAYTSRRIVRKIKERDGIHIDLPSEALGKISKLGYTHVVCQSLHVINGIEYEKTLDEVSQYNDVFEKITLGKPLLTDISDYEHTADFFEGITSKHEAVLLMGHGTVHHSNAAYCMLEEYLRYRGIKNIYIATVEGFPVLEHAINKMQSDGLKKITLMPFMIVAGDHAINDMAGEKQGSWKNILKAEGFDVQVDLTGLGEYNAVAELFYLHSKFSNKIPNRPPTQ